MRRFAVIGLGRFGSKLAVALSMSGAEVIAIDKNREVVDLIRDQVGHAVRLDSTDEEALRAQGVHNVDVAIISMGQKGFEDAILTVVTLRQMGVQQVYARAESLVAGQVFSKVGAPRSSIRARVRAAMGVQAYRPPDRRERSTLRRVPGLAAWPGSRLPPASTGKTVMDLQLRQKFNVNLVLIKRSDEYAGQEDREGAIIAVPMPGTVVYEGDILMVAGSDADLARLPQE